MKIDNKPFDMIPESEKENEDLFLSGSDSEEIRLDELDENVPVKQPRRWWFWRANNPLRIKFDLLVMILATFNWFQVPYQVAFTNPDDRNLFDEIFNAIIDITFITDVIINFRTSYFNDETGEEMLDCK